MTKKQTFIAFMLLLIAVSGWAQESKTEKKDSIPPIIVEGTLEGVPPETVVLVAGRQGGTCSYAPNQGDTLRNGKFRIVYTPDSPTDEYSLTSKYGPSFSRHALLIYVSPGTKATIKGVGIHEMNWYAKSDNPKQIEANEYRAYLDEKIPGYWDLKRRDDWVDKEDDDYDSVKKRVKEADSLYVEYMIEFMKDRKYSSVFARNIRTIAGYIFEGKNKNMGIRERAAKLLAIVPKDAPYDEYLDLARKYLLPKYEIIKIGEKLHDFVLYDHQGKEHHLTEFNGNGKYLLLEFNSRTCVPCVKHRPNDVLNNLYKNHSDKVDMLMVNNDDPYFWDIECKDPNKYGRDPWPEWNDKKGSEDIIQRYGLTGPAYFFVSPDGTILGRISDQEDLNAAIAKYFKL
ncbi:MAG: redoxin domain-containing protein [Prevotella sp.]|nr:redoxin domain-containing protein [Prevotella sp.]